MTIAVTRAAEGLDRRGFTVAAFERLEEFGIIDPGERLELIGGEIVPMAAKGNRHESIKVALTLHWGRTCPDDFLFAAETALRLDAWTYLEPDFIVTAAKASLLDITGPDVLLAVEVADTSLDYDLRRKPLVYAAFGVRELWVIDAARRRIHVHAEPGLTGYREVTIAGSADRLVPRHAPDAFAFALDQLRRFHDDARNPRR